jgi:UDP-glucose 4-epimerase
MILVTGGAGYIGSHFVKYYLSQPNASEVVVVDNLSEGYREALSFSNAIHFHQENIGNPEGMKAIFKTYPVEAVVHFAASCYVGESQHDPAKYFENNVVNSLRLFQAMEESGVRQIVFSSTCATYGNPITVPIDEKHPQNPINIYGLTKLMIEQALRGYSETKGWSFTALRYFNAAGADVEGLIGEHHDPETHLIPLILQAALGKRPAIQVFGNDYDTPDGTCIRDYIHVNDLASAHWKALERLKQQVGGEAINLGTTHGYSVLEVIDVCKQVTGLNIQIDMSPRRDGDPPKLVANADKAHGLLGWTPDYTLQSIIETAWNWEQNRRY